MAGVVAMVVATSMQCEASDVCRPAGPQPSAGYCLPTKVVGSFPQSPTKTYPAQLSLNNYIPGPCAQPYRNVPPVGGCPCGNMPVKVDSAVQPPYPCRRGNSVPVVCREPGPIKPIVGYSAALVGAVIAAPFRLAETVCPITAPACPYPVGCRPPQPTANGCSLSTAMPACSPPCPPTMCSPVPCGAWACPPPGPSMAPLPQAACVSGCNVKLPPALLEDYQFPQCEPQDLLSGIWNFPARLLQGRLTGDMCKPMPEGPNSCR